MAGGLVRETLLEAGQGARSRLARTQASPFKWFRTSPEIIRPAVMLDVRFPLSLQDVEDLLHERGVGFSHETIRFWWHRFGPMFAAEIWKRRIEGMKSSHWRGHLDEIFVRINGERHYWCRAVDHEGKSSRALSQRHGTRRRH